MYWLLTYLNESVENVVANSFR